MKNSIAFILGLVTLSLVFSIPYFGELLQESSEESLVFLAGGIGVSLLLKKPLRIPLALFFLGSLCFQSFRILPWRLKIAPSLHATPVTAESRLRLGSFNILRSNQPSRAALEWIRNQDVTVLLEFTPAWEAETQDLLGPKHPSDGYLGMAILSRKGCTSQEIGLIAVTSMPNETFAPWMRCTVEINRQLVDIFAMHPIAPLGIAHIKDRRAYFDKVLSIVGASYHPKIMAGDFNTAPWTNLVGALRRQTRMFSVYDTYPAASTYPTQRYLPFLFGLPIDHLWLTQDIQVLSFRRGEDFGSDHFSIEADLAFDRVM